jgi:hypothetical protein
LVVPLSSHAVDQILPQSPPPPALQAMQATALRH